MSDQVGRIEFSVVTGANSRFFLMAAMLLESLKSAPFKTYVCDFGLSSDECSWLAKRDALLRMPASNQRIATGVDPWILKTEIESYIAPLPQQHAIVWVDADIIVLPGFASRLSALVQTMSARDIQAAAVVDSTFGHILSLTDLALDPLADAVARLRIAPDTRYFNSGFVVFNSRALLSQWAQLARTIPLHALYDQNILNLLIARANDIDELPAAWNLHGRSLDCAWEGRDSPLVLHATSSIPGHLDVFDCKLNGTTFEMRLFIDGRMRALQIDHLNRVMLDLAPVDPPVHCFSEKAPLRWDFSRNQPCPCLSGERYKHCHGRR